MYYGTANFGITGTDWQQKVNWDRLRKYRLESARARMKEHGLGAMLCMYDENGQQGNTNTKCYIIRVMRCVNVKTQCGCLK